MTALFVGLEDVHVGDGAEDEEHEEDGAYRDVDVDGGDAAEAGCCRWVGRGEIVLG